jgi:hypothetical protein
MWQAWTRFTLQQDATSVAKLFRQSKLKCSKSGVLPPRTILVHAQVYVKSRQSNNSERPAWHFVILQCTQHESFVWPGKERK